VNIFQCLAVGSIDLGQGNLSAPVASLILPPLSLRGKENKMMTHGELAKAKPVVLVIDDDPAVRNSLKFALEIEGFSVRLYPAGAELLEETEMPASGCIVTDYHLPGMNGLDLLARLRERNIRLPAILITTHPSVTIRNQAELAGVRLIEKPLLSDTLFQGIRAALGESAVHQ